MTPHLRTTPLPLVSRITDVTDLPLTGVRGQSSDGPHESPVTSVTRDKPNGAR